MNRARAIAAVLFGIGWICPATAQAQNLEAGKSPAQLFSNTCAACHKSARGLVRTVPPGSLPSFLREHYTTSREMAQQLSGYLMASGGTDTRGRPQEARQAPPGAEPPQQPPVAQQPQQPPQQARQSLQELFQPQRPPPRPVAEEPAAPPPESPAAKRAREAEERRQARREQRAKQAQEAAAAERDKNRRSRVTPARIDATAARGKDALPLGEVMKQEPPKEEVASPPPAPEPKPVQMPSETATRPDPVPQVTPAPQASEPPKETAAPEPPVTADPPADSTGAKHGDTPSAPPSGGPPPVPPISN